MTDHGPTGRLTRRNVVVAGVGGAAGLGVLGACGGGSSSATDPKSDASSSPGAPLVALAAIPVGGAVSATSSSGGPLIIAQPTAGKVVAFSAICTHRGCTVAPAGAILKCPCHGSTYDLATGDNTGGPAPSPLTAVSVKVQGDQVVAG